MRINPIVFGILVLTVFFGTILGFQAAGVWSVSGKVSTSGDSVQPSADDVNSIKGWMTLEQITTTYNVPLAELLQQFELPADTAPTTAIKDLESDLFSVTNLRTWLQTRKSSSAGTSIETPPTTNSGGADTSGGADAALPEPTAASPARAETATPAPTEHVTPDKTVTGKTTFQELLDWGVSKEAIQKAIGGELPDPATMVKDYVTEKGMEFPTIKSTLQAEVDKVK
jgi:hypothetical protein